MQAGRSRQTSAAVISHATTEAQEICEGTLENLADRVEEAKLTSPALIIVGDVVALRSQLHFFEDKPLWGKRYLVAKIGPKPSRLASMLRAKGAYTSECMTGEIVGVPAVYTAQELAHVDVLLFTSANGVDYFMKNVFASGLDARALFHTRCAVLGQKTAQKLREYGICADFMPEHSNSTNLAQELKEYLDQKFRGDPFKRAVIWYPTAKNAKDNLVDTLLSFCDCGRLNVYENVPCPMELPVDTDVYDAIFFTCASSAERMLGSLKPQERETLASVTDIYSIGPKCSAALGELGVSPVIEAAVNTYEGLVNCVLRKE